MDSAFADIVSTSTNLVSSNEFLSPVDYMDTVGHSVGCSKSEMFTTETDDISSSSSMAYLDLKELGRLMSVGVTRQVCLDF